jgi:hypothetical protein
MQAPLGFSAIPRLMRLIFPEQEDPNIIWREPPTARVVVHARKR